MIAQDTGHVYVDETEFGTHDRDLFDTILMERDQIVVQCPTMCYAIHKYSTADTLVVMMMRDVDDIVASEQRVGWTVSPYNELANYGLSRRQSKSYRLHEGQVAPIKYHHWYTIQRDQIENCLELEYESLSEHRLWVPKGQRVNFKADQTEVDSGS